MKALFRIFSLTLALLAGPAQAQLTPPSPAIAANAWLLIDHGSGQELAANRPDDRIEPASLTKLMTAYLSFAALKQGVLKPNQTVPVSETIKGVPGSRMFIEPRLPVTVDQLVRGMIVQSGNDACVALAETIAGSEAAFAERMNREARRLGLTATHFVNATGLPDPQHYTTARDLGRLVRALIRDFPEYYPIYASKEYTYNRITQPNRNRLLWLDPTVDGVKTGHTEAAGYCLIASAKRGPRRLISVVLGTDSDSARAQESLKLLNFGFQYFDGVQLYSKGQAISQLKVFKGAQGKVKAGFPDSLVISLPRDTPHDRLRVQLASRQPLVAPVAAGAVVATLKVFVDDKPWGEYPVQALEAVPVAGIIGRAWDTLWLWFE
ncbi:D-alanyl-D-alanine carboxypeptidase family protein [Denitratisoma oestradiolicum]|uniref:serine-type D-Ala-D-Ala carboxypeptidase n=1 Tax=Denitratisoma oestradiolicum TaxID=311182 RepID=A0A6S6XZE8_9PROT|nr:D-alanyl-D-alanine carboxypeptidase family protein [Denitratisoma oestradiolicum]TWO79651.1 peptidase [Denitratisoma oestradiolicum]CAB1370458.1 D-alanyl-D-alanine carboxypeptidase DacC [Denitratisoma oestradiolicum]